MFLNNIISGTQGNAYVAGTGDGIVTVAGKTATRQIVVLSADSLSVIARTMSLPTGRYIVMGLSPEREYLVMARDYKKEYEPFAWDYVAPADDLTIAEQQALWQSWQTN